MPDSPDSVDRSAAAPPGVSPSVRFDASRARALGFLAGGIAHDLANPLGAMLAFATYLATDPRLPPDLRDDARLLRQEADRTHRLVRTLLDFARERAPATTDVSVKAVLEEVLALAAYRLAGVSVTRDVADELVATDACRLRHLALVLVVDAIQGLTSSGAPGRLLVAASPSPEAPGEVVRLTLEYRRDPDTATPGDPDPRTAEVRVAAQAVATEIGARLRFEPLPDGGRHVMELPAVGAPPLAGTGRTDATRPGSEASEAGRLTVLVCEDEAMLRRLIVRQLESAGFRTIQVADAGEALEVLETTAVDAVLTDHNMRAMSGVELFERAVAERPQLRTRFVLMSGDAGAEDLVNFADATGVAILPKPFELAGVVSLVRDIVTD